jgi:predicted TPR repeat methyltransferase
MQISNHGMNFAPPDKIAPRQYFASPRGYDSLAPDPSAILAKLRLIWFARGRLDLSKASGQLSGVPLSDKTAVLAASWLASGSPRTDAGRLPRLEPQASDLPAIVADIGAGEIAARIAAWRAGNPQFDALLREDAPPAQALRRLALTQWAAGHPRVASMILATAAALSPDSAPLWQELGFTLQAIGERSDAREAFERSLALDPAPARAWLGLAMLANELEDKERAEAAFAAALHRDPLLSEAAFGLGLICFEQRRYTEAAGRWRAAIATGCQNSNVHIGLAQCLFFMGDFAGSARAFERHIASGAADPVVIQRFALTRFLETAIADDTAAAHEAYRRAAGPHAEDPKIVARSAFSLLSGYGYREAALRIGRERLSSDGADPVQRYLLDAIAGVKLERAPRDYLVSYFDHFAEGFDKQLVEVLGYRVPDQLMGMIAATGSQPTRAVDLGCGTGLAGPGLRAARSRLVGVDLSPRMLDKAAERGCYDALIEADLMSFLEQTSERFDLVFAADTLVYLGGLEDFFAAAARVAISGGILAFNVETTALANWVLLPSGRFAHCVEALLASAAPWFTLRSNQTAFLRVEANQRVEGALVVLERRAL